MNVHRREQDPEINPGLVADGMALLDARDVLAPNGGLNWTEEHDICTWDGVTVSGRVRRVTALDLRNSRLTGRIPAELGRLPSLTDLNLRDNQLTGEIPEELGRLQFLRVLDLRNNRLTGPIPTEWTALMLPNIGREIHAFAFTLRLSGNDLEGCIPVILRNANNHDLDELNLPDCQ